MINKTFVFITVLSLNIFAQSIDISVFPDQNETKQRTQKEVLFQSEEPPKDQKPPQNQESFQDEQPLQNEQPSQKEEQIASKTIFLSYEKAPKSVYKGEVFPVRTKAIVALDDFEKILTEFKSGYNVEVINPKSNWKWYSDNIFYNTFYFKAKEKNVIFPEIHVNFKSEEGFDNKERLLGIKPKVIDLKGDKLFSSVIAKSLSVKKYKTNRFDNESNIIIIEIEAQHSNLDDFELSWVIRDGIDSSFFDLPNYKIYYFAIIPDFQKRFEFTYFDLKGNKFQKISLPIEIDGEKVSTQIDLNPKDSKYAYYKNLTVIFFGILFMVLFFARKKKIYLALAFISLFFVFMEQNPLNTVKIPEKTNISILPMKGSTIFYTTDRNLLAEELDRHEGYIKVLLLNGKIGWVKNENIIEN